MKRFEVDESLTVKLADPVCDSVSKFSGDVHSVFDAITWKGDQSFASMEAFDELLALKHLTDFTATECVDPGSSLGAVLQRRKSVNSSFTAVLSYLASAPLKPHKNPAKLISPLQKATMLAELREAHESLEALTDTVSEGHIAIQGHFSCFTMLVSRFLTVDARRNTATIGVLEDLRDEYFINSQTRSLEAYYLAARQAMESGIGATALKSSSQNDSYQELKKEVLFHWEQLEVLCLLEAMARP